MNVPERGPALDPSSVIPSDLSFGYLSAELKSPVKIPILDVAYEFQFDVREIQTKNVCVWHAADDKYCPPEHGKWLAEMFQARDGVRVDFRADDLGQCHFTYNTGKFIEPENSMIKSLLEGLKPA
jgi:hypothetical protein